MLLESFHTGLHLHKVRWFCAGFGLGPLHLSLMPGEQATLFGSNGAGKSSLLHLIAGDHRPCGGQISFHGQNLHQLPTRALARRRAILSQFTRSISLCAAETIALGRLPYNNESTHIQRKYVYKMADLTETGHLLRRRCDSLSGGELRRVHLARVLCQLHTESHGLLLLDEPMASVDPQQQTRILEEIRSFSLVRNHILLMILHQKDLAPSKSFRHLFMENGLLKDIKTETIIDLPKNGTISN